jgi:hypothetical protein
MPLAIRYSVMSSAPFILGMVAPAGRILAAF